MTDVIKLNVGFTELTHDEAMGIDGGWQIIAGAALAVIGGASIVIGFGVAVSSVIVPPLAPATIGAGASLMAAGTAVGGAGLALLGVF